LLEEEDLTRAIIGGAIEVHRAIGPGLLESAYEACLFRELTDQGLDVRRQVPLAVEYKGDRLDCGYRLDLVVESRVIVELKCVERIQPIHTAQLMTYLRLASIPVGLLMNFHVPVMREGIVRKVLTRPHHHPKMSSSAPSAPPR